MIVDKRDARNAKAKARAAKMREAKNVRKMASIAEEKKRRTRAQTAMNATVMADAHV